MRHIATIQTEFLNLATDWWSKRSPESQEKYLQVHRSKYSLTNWHSLGPVEFVTFNLPDDVLTITADNSVIPESKKLQNLLLLHKLPRNSTHYSFSLGKTSEPWEDPFKQKASPTAFPITAARTAISAMIGHISSKQPTQFTFTADKDEPTRVKLYDALRPKLESLGYKLFNNSAFEDQNTTTWHYVKSED